MAKPSVAANSPKHGDIARVKLPIQRILVNADGTGVIICSPSIYNEKGSFKLSEKGMKRLASHCNCSSPRQLSAIVSKGATFEFDARYCVEGAEYVDEKTGVTGKHKSTFWNTGGNHAIELTAAQRGIVLNVMIQESALADAAKSRLANMFADVTADEAVAEESVTG